MQNGDLANNASRRIDAVMYSFRIKLNNNVMMFRRQSLTHKLNFSNDGVELDEAVK